MEKGPHCHTIQSRATSGVGPDLLDRIGSHNFVRLKQQESINGSTSNNSWKIRLDARKLRSVWSGTQQKARLLKGAAVHEDVYRDRVDDEAHARVLRDLQLQVRACMQGIFFEFDIN